MPPPPPGIPLCTHPQQQRDKRALPDPNPTFPLWPRWHWLGCLRASPTFGAAWRDVSSSWGLLLSL